MIKLLMSWNIRPGYEDEYFEFIVREFGPTLVELGIRPTDAWYTYYSERPQPQILTGGIVESLERLQQILSSDRWHKLKESLLTYVTDYQQKIVPASGTIQM